MHPWQFIPAERQDCSLYKKWSCKDTSEHFHKMASVLQQRIIFILPISLISDFLLFLSFLLTVNFVDLFLFNFFCDTKLNLTYLVWALRYKNLSRLLQIMHAYLECTWHTPYSLQDHYTHQMVIQNCHTLNMELLKHQNPEYLEHPPL